METLQRAANRGSISTGYDIDNSLKVENANAEEVYRTPASAGNRKTWTYSVWIKRSKLSYNMMLFGSNDTYAYFQSNDTLLLRFTGTYNFITLKQFRDTAAWNHIVVAVDTTQATNTNRVKVYFNGEDHAGLFDSDSFPALNTDTSWNWTTVQYAAGWATSSFNPSGYLSEIHNIDGQQLTASDFGEFDADTGIWKPKEYTGTYGTNGFHLDFSDSGSLGADSSGNGNNFTLNNITSIDQATDTPTNNFVTLNPRYRYPSSQIFRNGNTQLVRSSGTGLNKTFVANVPVYNGKWYAEFKPNAVTNYVVGIMPDVTASNAPTVFEGNYIGNSAFAESISYYSATGQKIVAPSGGSAYGDTYTDGDVIGIALDMDNNFVYFSKNGTWQNSGDPTSGPSGTGGIALTNTTDGHLIGFSYDTGGNMICNYGGYHLNTLSTPENDANGYGVFEYAPPSGYYAICTKNLAEFG